MPLSVFVGSDEFAVTSASVFVGGAWKTVRRVEAWNGSAWKVVKNFAPAISASVNNPEVYAAGTATYLTTNSATVTPTGGLAPYTYAWTFFNGEVPVINAPSFATTTFSMNVGPGESLLSTVQCLVTDSLGQTATVFVTANFSNFSSS